MGVPVAANPYRHGAVVVVPDRVAHWLGIHGLDQLRVNARGVDPEVDAVLLALRVAALDWRASAQEEVRASGARINRAPSGELVVGTAQAARLLAITPRAVRLALQEGRLVGECRGGRWQIPAENVRHYQARKVA